MYAALYWPHYDRDSLPVHVPTVVLHPLEDMVTQEVIAAHFQRFRAEGGGEITGIDWEERFMDYLIERGYWLPWIVSTYEVPIAQIPSDGTCFDDMEDDDAE